MFLKINFSKLIHLTLKKANLLAIFIHVVYVWRKLSRHLYVLSAAPKSLAKYGDDVTTKLAVERLVQDGLCVLLTHVDELVRFADGIFRPLIVPSHLEFLQMEEPTGKGSCRKGKREAGVVPTPVSTAALPDLCVHEMPNSVQKPANAQ